jgi:hypothetical protein
MQGLLEAANPSAVAISSVIQVRPFPDVFAYGSYGQLITGPAGPGGPAEAEGGPSPPYRGSSSSARCASPTHLGIPRRPRTC